MRHLYDIVGGHVEGVAGLAGVAFQFYLYILIGSIKIEFLFFNEEYLITGLLKTASVRYPLLYNFLKL